MVSSTDGQKRAVQRLIAIAGMLGSDHEGERANAARLATIDLRQLGLTWAELIERAFAALEAPPRREAVQEGWEPQARPERRPSPGKRTARRNGVSLWEFVRYASLRKEQLGPWDIGFLNTFLTIGPKCQATESQWRQIDRIAEKLNMAA